MKTYSSLSVAQVVKYINLQNEQHAKEIIIQMVRSTALIIINTFVSHPSLLEKINEGELSAKLLPDGTLIFQEDAMDEKAFAPAAIQAMLLKAQQEGRELQEMSQVMASSRQLLAKVRIAIFHCLCVIQLTDSLRL